MNRMRIAWAAGLLAGMGGGTLDAQELSHARSVLPIAEEVLARHFADADGDGLLDLWVAVRESGGSRAILLFRQREGRLFPAQPDERIPVPRAVVCWTVGRFTAGARGAQLAYIARDAVYVRGSDGERRKIATGRMLLDMPSDDALPRWPHLGDLDGDGLDELVLVVETGFDVVGADGLSRGQVELDLGGERHPAAEQDFLDGALRANLSSQELSEVFVPNDDAGVVELPPALYSSVRLPAPALVDVNGDGRLDLSYYHSRKLFLHLQTAEGRFTGKADLILRIERESDTDESRLEWVAQGGGPAADLLLVRSVEGGATSFTSDWQLRIWSDAALAALPAPVTEENPAPDPAERSLPQPSVFVKVSASFVRVYVEDLNGDGLRDVGLSAWELDVPMLGAGESTLSHEVSAYLAEAGGGLSSRPAFVVEREFGIAELESLRDVPAFAADVTGDGRADMIESTKSGNVEVRALVASGSSWTPSGSVSYRIPVDAAAASLDVLDLNQDRVGDFVVSRKGQLEIYLSQRR